MARTAQLPAETVAATTLLMKDSVDTELAALASVVTPTDEAAKALSATTAEALTPAVAVVDPPLPLLA